MVDGKEKIVLGSGTLYSMEYTGTEIPADAEIELDANVLGLIQGGASIEYSKESYTAKDDLGLREKTIITSEDALLKSGIMTWSGATLAKLCSTAQVTEDTTTGERLVEIGGVGNQDGKSYVIHFVHDDPVDGWIKLTIVGSNQAGFTLAFAKDKETVIDAEFKAQPHNVKGTLIRYREQIPTA